MEEVYEPVMQSLLYIPVVFSNSSSVAVDVYAPSGIAVDLRSAPMRVIDNAGDLTEAPRVEKAPREGAASREA